MLVVLRPDWLIGGIAKIKSEDIFSKMSNFWKKTMINLGGEYSIWSNAPEDLSHN